jgi:hypothetical protein
MRKGEVKKTPGFDGVYGSVEAFTAQDRKRVQQESLF